MRMPFSFTADGNINKDTAKICNIKESSLSYEVTNKTYVDGKVEVFWNACVIQVVVEYILALIKDFKI